MCLRRVKGRTWSQKRQSIILWFFACQVSRTPCNPFHNTAPIVGFRGEHYPSIFFTTSAFGREIWGTFFWLLLRAQKNQSWRVERFWYASLPSNMVSLERRLGALNPFPLAKTFERSIAQVQLSLLIGIFSKIAFVTQGFPEPAVATNRK